jgi:Cu+-exporting ATPase
MRLFGSKQFYLKQASVLEEFTLFDHVVFDKTGTITQNHATDIHFEGEKLTEADRKDIKALVHHSSHPLSRSISGILDVQDCHVKVEAFEEIPGKGLSGRINNTTVRLGSSEFIMGTKDRKLAYNTDTGTSVHVDFDGRYMGCFRLGNRYRAGLEPMLKNLASHYRLAVLTGDNEGEKDNLRRIFPEGTQFCFNQSPQAKLDFIKNLQEKGARVLMVGDGLNDAGALKQSDIGISVTEDMVNFTPASHGIIHGSRIKELHQFIRFAFTAKRIIIVAFAISFLYNIIGISFAMLGMLSPLIAAILMPLSSISVVAFATVVTTLAGRIKHLR